MADLGYTFEPGSNQKRLLNGINQGRLSPAANEALRVLSLKLPTVLGGSPIAPEDMLRPKVGGSGPGGAVLDSLRAAGTPAPAPLVTGAGAGGPLNVAKFGPFGAPPSDLGSIGQIAHAAVNPPGSPTFTPGGEDHQGYQPPNPTRLSPEPVGRMRGPGGDTGAAPAADLFGTFMQRILSHGQASRE